jgi:oligopeptide/dipeptide ABC transporter ATP-binding protein
MYLGRIVEMVDSDTLYTSPKHPYTKALISSVPVPDPRIERTRSRILLEGDLPSPDAMPTGCAFRSRCWKQTDICATNPALVGTGAHLVACHHPEPS